MTTRRAVCAVARRSVGAHSAGAVLSALQATARWPTCRRLEPQRVRLLMPLRCFARPGRGQSTIVSAAEHSVCCLLHSRPRALGPGVSRLCHGSLASGSASLSRAVIQFELAQEFGTGASTDCLLRLESGRSCASPHHAAAASAPPASDALCLLTGSAPPQHLNAFPRPYSCATTSCPLALYWAESESGQ